jgi:hypothetical protein
MVFVAACAAVVAMFIELARGWPNQAPHVATPAGITTALVVIAGLSVGAGRRSGLTETIAAVGIAAGSLALYGGLRGTYLLALCAPGVLTTTLLIPLWISRVLPGDASGLRGHAHAITRAGRAGMDAGLTLLCLAACLFVCDAVAGLLPMAPPVLPSPSFVLPSPPYAGASPIVPASTGRTASRSVASAPLLPDLAPAPPSMSLDEVPSLSSWR